MNSSRNDYGVTEVFVKHDYYAGLRVKLLKQVGDKLIQLKDEGDRLNEVGEITTTKKIYDAPQGFLSITTDYQLKYIYEEGDFAIPRYKYIMHVGSSRSSKSWSIEEWCIRQCEDITNLRINVWRDTRASLGDSVWKDFKKIFPLSGRKYKFTKNTTPLYFENTNSTIEPHGADVTNAHGMTQDIAWLNEPYRIGLDTFNQIDQRCEQMILDLNPKENHWSDNVSRHPRCIVIHSTFMLNPFCPPEQKRKILSYDPKNPINVKNGTADPYMWDVYGLGIKAEKPNKVYSGWKKISYFEFMAIDSPIYYGLDWGTVHPMGIVEVKYYDGTFYINELSYLSENQLVAELITLYGIDYQKRLQEQGLGVITWHLQRIGINKKNVIVCDSAKPDKIIELRRAGYNAYPAHKPQGSVFSGISLVKRANICYTDISYNLENEYNSYEWNTDRYGLVTEEPIKLLDDVLDPTRYVITFVVGKLRIDL